MDAAPLLIAAVMVIIVGIAAYRKFRIQSEETFRRMPPGNDEEVIPPED